MSVLSKRRRAFQNKTKEKKYYCIRDGIRLVKQCATAKFSESVDVAINLGIDARKSEQKVRGATILPGGIGKTFRIAVFAQGEQAEKARKAGADVVGLENLVEQIKKSQLDFDVVIATPDAMPVVGQLGQILGPRGLMPNPKLGTLTDDITVAVNNARGQVRYRSDRNGIIHCAIGTVQSDTNSLQANLEALLTDLKKVKPAGAKGTYFKKLTLSSTMGPAIFVDCSTIVI